MCPMVHRTRNVSYGGDSGGRERSWWCSGRDLRRWGSQLGDSGGTGRGVSWPGSPALESSPRDVGHHLGGQVAAGAWAGRTMMGERPHVVSGLVGLGRDFRWLKVTAKVIGGFWSNLCFGRITSCYVKIHCKEVRVEAKKPGRRALQVHRHGVLVT